MDGVFMKKIIKISVCLLLVVSAVLVADVWQDKKALQKNLIRLHVVANSDSQEDQTIKLQVKDAVVSYLQPIVEDFTDKEQTMEFLAENLASVQQVANDALFKLGVEDCAIVSLGTEVFDTRKYDTFSLPAGIYDSLRIRIGEGRGKNWWCVVFPSLCLPATADGFQDTAVSSGFSEELGNTLSNGRNFRFFVLDCFGKIEKLFH